MDDLPAVVQRLADLEAIRDLVRRYAHSIWQGRPLDAVALFAADVVMDLGPDGVIRGRENLRAIYTEKAGGDMLLHPFVHNHVIDYCADDTGDASRATGTCYLDLRCLRDGQSLMGSGVYNDVYVREQGVWRFKSRKLAMCYLVRPGDSWL
ncbi:MAG: nuclear transport factor 2 family protein [Halioglobus sp.]|nr:nuclear transport factor 2 family protein [Halioglobus sp.]